MGWALMPSKVWSERWYPSTECTSSCATRLVRSATTPTTTTTATTTPPMSIAFYSTGRGGRMKPRHGRGFHELPMARIGERPIDEVPFAVCLSARRLRLCRRPVGEALSAHDHAGTDPLGDLVPTGVA